MLADFKIWHQASKSGQGELAAETGAQILDFFQNFYKIEYPLPKMDVAAIPDFRGAMENWGLITFEEDGLLYQEGISDVINKEDTILVI